MTGLRREMGAHRKANQIVGVGDGVGFIKVIDSPDQAAFDVAPGTKILHVQITDSQDLRSLSPDRCTTLARSAAQR